MHVQQVPSYKNQSRFSPKNTLLVIGILASIAIYIFKTISIKQSAVLVLGLALGATLYWATFSFSNGWRSAITERKSIWIRAQMMMLVVASILMIPLIVKGSFFGHDVQGFSRPLGMSLLVGAFMFGIGMQVAGSCASGSLYHMGGGRLKMLIVLSFFAGGALLATAHYGWWMEKSNFEPVVWMRHVGLIGAIMVNTGIAAIIYFIAIRVEKNKHTTVEPLFTRLKTKSLGSTLLVGGIALACLNFLTLIIAGRPWSVASAFPFWGAKTSQRLGIELDLDFWDYWSTPTMETMLNGGLLESTTSLMNIGIMLGALGVAISLKRYTLSWKISWRETVGAVIGGLMLGYGSTIAFGCNIGAFFGGVVSGSLHGWIWFLAAFIGTWVGIKLRPWFNLDA